MQQFKSKLLSACIATLSLGPGIASAQNAKTGVALEEVVVTAQKRSESLQDAPITVNVLSGEKLEQAQISDIRSLAQYTPGLQMDAFPQSQPRPFIRGVGSSDRGAGGDQSAAAFMDGVYLSRPAFLSFDNFDLERIEVLKGPQGTLWGKNVVGGAMHIITNKPQAEFDSRLSITAGNEGIFNSSVMVNSPIGENGTAIRAVLNRQSHDGFTRNVYLDKDQDDQDRWSGRVHAQFYPSEKTDLLVTAYGSTDDNAGAGRHQYSLTEAGVSWDPDGSARKSTANVNGYDKKDIWGVNAALNWDLDFATFSGLLAYRELDYSKLEDIDGNNVNDQLSGGISGIQQLDFYEAEQTDVLSIETRLAAPDDSIIFWQIGAFYENDDIMREQELNLLLPAADRDVNETIITPNETDSLAVFGEVTYPLSDRASITGGLRWSKDEKEFGATAAQVGSGRVFVRETYTGLTASDSWSEVTWRVTGDMHFNDNVFGYATVSRGYKTGGYQDTPTNPVDAVTSYKPETLINYEIGIKSDWDRARANISAFFMDFTDMQVRTTNSDGATITSNAGASEIKGIELELTYLPFESLSLGLNYAYTDAKFTDFIDEGVDFTGNTLPRAPKNTVAANITYYAEDAFATGGLLELGIDYAWRDERFDDFTNAPPEVVPAFGLVDARAVYTFPDPKWQISLWGSNLTNKEYQVHGPDFGLATWYLFAPPRTYGVTLNWSYL